MTKATGQKQNTCLLVWHTANVFLMTIIYSAIALVSIGIDLNGKDKQTLTYYAQILYLIATFVDFYVDLFLLWLLYRFMRPQETNSTKK